MNGIFGIARMLAPALLCFAATQARAGAPAAGGAATLREGTPVAVAFTASITSKTAVKGDPVVVELVNDLAVEGAIVAKAGCKAVGRVTLVKRASAPGKSGALNVQLDYLEVGNRKVMLRGSKDKADENGIQYSRPYHLKWPMGLLRTGDDIEIRQGTTLTVFAAEDISLPVAQ